MKVRELTVHPMLNITWRVRPFPSTTTTNIVPAQGIRGIAATRADIQDSAFVAVVHV
jgi:hypothetical protein